MTDGPFKSMTPDPTSQSRGFLSDVPKFRCDECGKWVYLGDWPFCAPDGHKR